MSGNGNESAAETENAVRRRDYRPPVVKVLGTVGALTKVKQVGGADGATFLGLDIGS